MYDFIIVGQGIAGTVLSFMLIKRGYRVLLIDWHNPSAASRVAAGLVNPITGRRMVKSWLIDDLLNTAEQTYSSMEQMLNISCYHKLSIVRILNSIKEQNDWLGKSAEPGYEAYCSSQLLDLNQYPIVAEGGACEILHGHRLEMNVLLPAWRKWLKDRELLLEDNFEHDALEVSADAVFYKGMGARHLVFCEGSTASFNPYFKWLPVHMNKGEALVIRTNELPHDKVLIAGMQIIPLEEEGLFYIGATYDWDDQTIAPTDDAKENIIEKLEKVFKGKYKLVEHLAGIRPTVADRRPLVGIHPQFDTLGIFCGMGTKGVSLAPYFAEQFVNYIQNKQPIHKEADISRFANAHENL